VEEPPPDLLNRNLCLSRTAMACEYSIYLPPSEKQALAAGEAALDVIDRMEDLLSVYRGDSEMSRVNRQASDEPVRTDGRLYDLLKLAADLYDKTDGAFDVATHALIDAWGFFRGPRRMPSERELKEALDRSGMDKVEMKDGDQTVRYHQPGLGINLGSIGKGFAIDKAITHIEREFAVERALFVGGRSSVYALGSPVGDERGWLVGIQNPYHIEQRLATVRLKDRALGTSASDKQFFETAGRRFGHLLDPRSGRPADELAGVSVLARNAATADGLATALFVMGLDKARDFCHNHPDIAALLVLKSGADGCASERPRVVTFNLPRSDVNFDPG
jgi:thiamine biosynthesis lipoprotein